jgi:hypothetical protein
MILNSYNTGSEHCQTEANYWSPADSNAPCVCDNRNYGDRKRI